VTCLTCYVIATVLPFPIKHFQRRPRFRSCVFVPGKFGSLPLHNDVIHLYVVSCDATDDEVLQEMAQLLFDVVDRPSTTCSTVTPFFCIRRVRLSERELVLDGKGMMEMEFSVR